MHRTGEVFSAGLPVDLGIRNNCSNINNAFHVHACIPVHEGKECENKQAAELRSCFFLA
jgi:hypothetical protein